VVTVQVFSTTSSAWAVAGARVKPFSSKSRSRAAPSAWVARHPKFSTKKVPTGVIITITDSAPDGVPGGRRSKNYAENNNG
jgi:hypothetical protein